MLSDNWQRIHGLYETCIARSGTPYQEFGEKMLALLEAIWADDELNQCVLSTSMYSLLLGTSDISHNVYISWQDDSKAYVVCITSDKDDILESNTIEETITNIR
ncbi:MAG: hypothetical protein AAFQ52_17395, partial [Chloroflexota bacterium]